VVRLHGFGFTGDMWAPWQSFWGRRTYGDRPGPARLWVCPITRIPGYTKKNQAGRRLPALMDHSRSRRQTSSHIDIGNRSAYALAANIGPGHTLGGDRCTAARGISDWDNIVRNPALWHCRFPGFLTRSASCRAGSASTPVESAPWKSWSGDPKKIDEDTPQALCCPVARVVCDCTTPSSSLGAAPGPVDKQSVARRGRL